jgi:hypothetical protein
MPLLGPRESQKSAGTMDKTTVFTKTAKGITQVNQKSASLSKDLMKVLKLIDGKSNFGQLMEKADLDKGALEKALNTLTKDGFSRVFQVRKEEADPFAEEDEFDFTAPGKMPSSTQRVVAGAANDITELARQQEKIESDAKARTQAQEQARAKAKTEAESRAKLEAEARAKAEAEQQAMEQARRAKEASERARAELDAKMREEETRKRALVDQQARLTAEQRAKEEQEQKRLAELRAKAEAEAKALAEARSRAEAEAQALARARADAEAAAKKQAAVATTAEQEMRARLKEEIEARIRGEMEQLLRNELEEKTRAEMSAQILAEAKLAAKAELEERLREERETLRNAEMEARRHAETAARARAEQEAKLRAEAEARARAETEARMKAEEEARQLRVRAERATQEAQARAREQQETAQHLEAKARAEVEEDERMRQEQARRAKEIADVLRTKVSSTAERDEDAPVRKKAAARRRPRKRGGLLKTVVYGTFGVVALLLIALHVVPLRPYAAKIERAMSGWLHDDVSIASLTFRLLPSPHLRVENLAVGKLLDAKATQGRIYMDIFTLFGEHPSITEIDLDGVSVSADAVKRIPTWGKAEGKAAAGGIALIRLRGVKMEVQPAIESFDADLSFARDGKLAEARLTGPGNRWRLDMKPGNDGTALTFNARDWQLPVGAPLQVSDVSMKGTLAGNEILVPEFEASALEGHVNGTLRVNWSAPGGPYHLDSELALAKVNATNLIGTFTKDIAVTGRLDGNFNLVTDGPTLDKLFAAPRVQGKFHLTEGSISNVDLVAVMQSDSAGTRAGVTKFAELSGEYGAAEQHSAFRQVSLQGGVLRGNGALDIGSNSNISGHVQLEIRSQVAQDRGAFNVSGTISRPIIRRGG